MNNDIEGGVKATTPTSGDTSESDLVWGAEAVGAEINRTREQVYHLLSTGALDGAVAKLGHRTIVGSRRKLRSLHLSGK